VARQVNTTCNQVRQKQPG